MTTVFFFNIFLFLLLRTLFLSAGIEANKSCPVAFKPLFHDNTTLSMRVNLLNVQWYEELTPEKTMQRFMQAVEICRDEFISHSKWVVEVCSSLPSPAPQPHPSLLFPSLSFLLSSLAPLFLSFFSSLPLACACLCTSLQSFIPARVLVEKAIATRVHPNIAVFDGIAGPWKDVSFFLSFCFASLLSFSPLLLFALLLFAAALVCPGGRARPA